MSLASPVQVKGIDVILAHESPAIRFDYLRDLRGSIDLVEASLTLRRTIRDLVESGRTKIILNFWQVNSMDSAGVGELAGAYVPVKSKGGDLKFLNPTKKVHDMLTITS